ncbi:hypothetical protein GOP47_0008985 [Adiantum capillus-veneris]|uniref:Uncharacterized protein n=1 Tax=Adiantum capillus-veneris TaxID=13818 RepID=A0A9D4UZD4_ADICA|nr:hypothetical protein GOP47_0008985 [Adiantum capillus-veneris]
MQQPQASPAVDSDNGTIPSSIPLRMSRVKRLDPPNKASHFEQIGALQTQIDSLQQRTTEIKSILDNRAQNRHIASPELVAARKKLADVNATFQQVLNRKHAHQEELELVKEKLRGSGSRSGLPEVSVEELDEQIRKLEYRQTHTTLPIEEERRLIVQIERLKKSRDSLRRHDSRAEQDQGSRTELLDLLKKDDQELNTLKAEQQEQRCILAEIREKEAALAVNIPALVQEKNGAFETIKGLRDDIKQLKVDFSAKEDEYWKREKEWRAQQALERKIRAEKGRAEWLEREKIRKQRALENFVEPYTNEIIMCEQLLSYMQKNAPLDEGAATPQQQQKTEIVAPEGFGVALVSKKNRNEDELDGWFAGSGSKKGKKVRGSTAVKSKIREKVSLSLDALTSFEKLKIPAPATYGDITKSIEELKVKKEKFVELQKKARELRESGENVGTHGVDGSDVVVDHEPSGKEALSAESSEHVEENGSRADPDVLSEQDSIAKAGDNDSSLLVESAEVDSSLKQDGLEEAAIADPADNKDDSQLDDKAHLETFEFSEAHLHSNEDVHIEEQAAETGVASVIFECGTQNGALEELSGENLNVEERVSQIVENGFCSHSGAVDAPVDETPASPKGSQSAISNTENEERADSNGLLHFKENGEDSQLSLAEEQEVAAECLEGKVL